MQEKVNKDSLKKEKIAEESRKNKLTHKKNMLRKGQ